MLPSSAASPRCPLCRKPAAGDHAPFCSSACKDRDLLRWLGGDYAITGDAAESDSPGLDSGDARD